MRTQDAAATAIVLLQEAEALARSSDPVDREKSQSLTWVADSWTRLAETLDAHPRIAPTLADEHQARSHRKQGPADGTPEPAPAHD